MSKEMMQNMIEEEISKKIILKFMDEVKKENPMFADILIKYRV